MKTNKFFENEAEANLFASANGGAVVTRNDTESFLLPKSFWAQLAGSPAAFAVAIRAHALSVWAGDVESAWSDALEGCIRGVPASAMSALDDQFRTRVVSTRWMVEYDDGVAAGSGSASIDAGGPGNEDGAWGSSSSDGWRVD